MEREREFKLFNTRTSESDKGLFVLKHAMAFEIMFFVSATRLDSSSIKRKNKIKTACHLNEFYMFRRKIRYIVLHVE